MAVWLSSGGGWGVYIVFCLLANVENKNRRRGDDALNYFPESQCCNLDRQVVCLSRLSWTDDLSSFFPIIVKVRSPVVFLSRLSWTDDLSSFFPIIVKVRSPVVFLSQHYQGQITSCLSFPTLSRSDHLSSFFPNTTVKDRWPVVFLSKHCQGQITSRLSFQHCQGQITSHLSFQTLSRTGMVCQQMQWQWLNEHSWWHFYVESSITLCKKWFLFCLPDIIITLMIAATALKKKNKDCAK